LGWNSRNKGAKWLRDDLCDTDTVHYVWNNDAGDTWGWGGAPAIPQDKWAMVALTIDPEKAVAYVYSDDTGLKSGANKIKHLEQTMGNII